MLSSMLCCVSTQKMDTFALHEFTLIIERILKEKYTQTQKKNSSYQKKPCVHY